MNLNISNKKVSFQYEIYDHFEAGIQLTGTEIKSVRLGKASLSDGYCVFIGNELWVKNLHIAEYTEGSYNNHEPKRNRKLLLHKRELRKLLSKVKEKGFTIIPVKMYLTDKGLAKLDIALAKGKKYYDKRASIKEKDIKKEMAKALSKNK